MEGPVTIVVRGDPAQHFVVQDALQPRLLHCASCIITWNTRWLSQKECPNDLIERVWVWPEK